MGNSRQSRRSEASFAQLEPRIHHVSEAVVKKKWKRLPSSSQDNVRDILVSAQKQSKSVQKTGKKLAYGVDQIAEEVMNRLIERLPRMPFPTTSAEDTFDFELTLHRIQNIEQQLTDNVHSMNLLRAQIKKEEQLLDADKREIKTLNSSLKSNDALRRQQSKNLHDLARRQNESVDFDVKQTQPRFDNLQSSGDSTDLHGLLRNPTVSATLQQLKHHLESMENNTHGMQRVVECMQETNGLLVALHASKLARSQQTTLGSTAGN